MMINSTDAVKVWCDVVDLKGGKWQAPSYMKV